MKEKIIEIIGSGMEHERAECMADQIIKINDEFISGIRTALQYNDIQKAMDIIELIASHDDVSCKTCKWFAVGYGKCTWCKRTHSDGTKDNYNEKTREQYYCSKCFAWTKEECICDET